MKGVTCLKPGYVFAPYTPLQTTPVIFRKVNAWFEKSPQPGDLIMFHWSQKQPDGSYTWRQASGLCTRAWTMEKCGECLYETGDFVEFEKDPPFSGSSWVEVIGRTS